MTPRPRSARQARAQYPVRVAKLTDSVGARHGQIGIQCDICRPGGALVDVTIGVRHMAETAAAKHAATHDLPWPPEDHPAPMGPGSV